jgi:hypothetical protein
MHGHINLKENGKKNKKKLKKVKKEQEALEK